MSAPQPGIFHEGSTHHYFLEYNLRSQWNPARLSAALRGIADACPAGVNLVIAFGRDAWQRLAPDDVPENFFAFHPVLGRDDRIAPGTQTDVLLWIHGDRHDLNYGCAMRIDALLAGTAVLELDLHGFSYLDSRDLTGFVDGTENPHDAEARDVALLPQGRPGAGGSFVLAQRWVHDLARFGALGTEEQERVIGRTREDSVELDDAPPTAHVKRAEVTVDDVALKIYRRSVPYGTLREKGLYFLAFSRNQLLFATQLDRMFGLAEDGLSDRLTEFSTPVSGSYFFAPSAASLQRVMRADRT